MTLLRTIEHRIEGLFERGFRRAFRSSLQPVELARKLGREMEENKTVSVSRVYVPNDFTVFLSPVDREQFASFGVALSEELESYLAAQARAGGYAMVAAPSVTLEADADLRQGEFGIACRMVETPAFPPDATPGVPAPDPSQRGAFRPAGAPAAAPRPQPVPRPPAPVAEAVMVSEAAQAKPPAPPLPAPPNRGLQGVSGTQVMSAADARQGSLPRETLTIVTAGGRQRISKRVTTIGRSRECDIVLPDANTSRLHAELRHSGQEYVIVDMGSTNGLEVNGRSAKRQALAHGDVVLMGTTELRVEVS